VRIAFYCKCGMAAVGRMEPDRYAKLVLEKLREGHQGEGHGRCTPATARRARALADQAAALGREESSS